MDLKVRIIIEHDHREINGHQSVEFETLDIDCPELVRKLSAGGYAEDSYSARKVVGAELIAKPDHEKE